MSQHNVNSYQNSYQLELSYLLSTRQKESHTRDFSIRRAYRMTCVSKKTIPCATFVFREKCEYLPPLTFPSFPFFPLYFFTYSLLFPCEIYAHSLSLPLLLLAYLFSFFPVSYFLIYTLTLTLHFILSHAFLIKFLNFLTYRILYRNRCNTFCFCFPLFFFFVKFISFICL